MKIKEREKGNVVILDVSGKIVLGEDINLLKEKIDELLKNGKKNIILNLADVPYVDSTGLGEIIRAYVSTTKNGGTLKLLKISEKIKDLLVISKLITTFEKNIFDDEEEAVKSFK